MNNYTYDNAIKAGLNHEQALQITNGWQVQALQDVPFEKAIQFSYVGQVYAMKNGIAFEEALQYTHLSQVDALNYVVFPYKALQVVNPYQYIALANGVEFELALQFNNMCQRTALERYHMSSEEAVKFSSDDCYYSSEHRSVVLNDYPYQAHSSEDL